MHRQGDTYGGINLYLRICLSSLDKAGHPEPEQFAWDYLFKREQESQGLPVSLSTVDTALAIEYVRNMGQKGT